MPAFTIAVCLHAIDERAGTHNVDLEVAAEAAGVIGLNLNEHEAGALLGTHGDPARAEAFMEAVDSDLLMFDDRKGALYHLEAGDHQ